MPSKMNSYFSKFVVQDLRVHTQGLFIKERMSDVSE
jgi:hypothetical protein